MKRDKSESVHLRQAGLKVTAPRVKILKILDDSGKRHLSAEDVYQRLKDGGEDVGLATVYRVLAQFETAGLLARHHFAGGHSVYELDPGDHHDHIVCVECGRVDEFSDATIEERQREIAQKAGYRMTDHCLYIYGVCRACRKGGRAQAPD